MTGHEVMAGVIMAALLVLAVVVLVKIWAELKRKAKTPTRSPGVEMGPCKVVWGDAPPVECDCTFTLITNYPMEDYELLDYLCGIRAFFADEGTYSADDRKTILGLVEKCMDGLNDRGVYLEPLYQKVYDRTKGGYDGH